MKDITLDSASPLDSHIPHPSQQYSTTRNLERSLVYTRSFTMAKGTMITGLTVGLLVLSTSAAFISERNWAPQDIITRDIAIIGGGATGTYAAVRLREDLNRSVVIVEKTDRLGGHTETFFDPVTGYPVNYGVEAWQNNSVVQAFTSRFNISLIPAPQPPFITEYLDFQIGKSIGYTPPTTADLGAALLKYFGLVQQYPYLAVGYNLPDPVPADLLIPFGDFVTKYGLQAAVSTIWTFSQSVGDFLKTPTLYVIQNFGITQLTALFTNGFVIPENNFNSQIYLEAAALLGTDVLYGSTLTDVARHVNGLQQLTVQTPTGLKLIKAKQILVTMPPTKDNMKPFTLNHHESELFNQWQTTTYYTGIIRNGVPDNVNIINTAKNTTFNIPTPPYVQEFSYTGVPGLHTFHTISLTNQSSADVSSLILGELNELATAGIFPASSPSIELLSNHSPLGLRVTADSVKEGFYGKLYALQGLKGTWYTGAAWASDYSAVLWEFTEGLLEGIVGASV